MVAWNKKGTFSHPLLMLGGVINNADHRDRGIYALYNFQEGKTLRGRGFPLPHPLHLLLCWNSDMMAGPQLVIYDHEEKASC